MGWASHYIERLRKGETVQFRPRGGSMAGKVESGQLVTVEPVNEATQLQLGDIVLCKVAGAEYLHLVKALRLHDVQIGNNKGGINGWTPRTKVYGVLTKVEP